MKKKIISFLTSAVMAATCLGGGLSELTSRIHLVNEPLTVVASIYSDEIAYGDYLTILKVDNDDDGIYDYIEIDDCDTSVVSIEIPAEIDGLPVTSIRGSAFYECKRLESITIPDSVTSIGGSAFDGTALLENQTGPVYYADSWVIACDTDVKSVKIKDSTKG
ncbi:MAG: leucine-rich repeat protein, partial [Porcipelethomonas sp.]